MLMYHPFAVVPTLDAYVPTLRYIVPTLDAYVPTLVPTLDAYVPTLRYCTHP